MTGDNHITKSEQTGSYYKVTLMVYILQAIALFTALPIIIAVIINYVKLDDVRGDWTESHFRWQLRTFWFGLLWYVVGVATIIFIIGYIILFVNWIWQIYRVTKGWLHLSEHEEMP